MTHWLVAARWFLATVFAVAAVTKLADRGALRRSMMNFGVPLPFAPAAAVLVPLAEGLVAAGLLVPPTARVSALAALSLLVTFLLVIGFNLFQGRKPDCHCFGRLHSAPIGLLTVLRNMALAGVALSLSYGAAHAAGLSVLVSATLIAIEVLRWRRRPVPTPRPDYSRLPTGLPVGSPAPEFALNDLSGAAISLADIRGLGKPIVLLFLNPLCGDCATLVPHIEAWQAEHGDRITFLIVSRGTTAVNRAKFNSANFPPVLLQTDYEVSNRFDAWVEPSAVYVKADGRIGSRLFLGSHEVRRLVRALVIAVEKARAKPQPSAASI